MSLRSTVALVALYGMTALTAAPAAAQAVAASAEDMAWMHAAPPTPTGGMPGRGGGGARSLGNPMEISEGVSLLAKAGVACRPTDGKLLSSRGREALYELACKDDFGWFVARDAMGGLAATDCIAVATQSKGLSHCLLPGNRSQLPGLQALADKAKATCKVTDGIWVGAGGSPPIVRYEATCAVGGGYILDTPKPGTTSDLIATACKEAPPLGLKCKLTKAG